MAWDRKTGDGSLLPLAALVGQTGKPRGTPPTAAEFRSLAANTLGADRRAEIESHIAHDPAVFKAFISSAATRSTAPAPTARVRQWLSSPVGLAAAASFAIAAVALGLFMNSGAPPVKPGQHTMAGTRPATTTTRSAPRDWRRRSVRYGLQNPGFLGGSGDADQGQALAAACRNGDCGAEIEALTDFGALLAGLSDQCADSPAARAPLDGASRGIEKLNTLRTDVTDRYWNAEMQNLARQLERPAPEACAAVSRVISAAGTNKN
jgi:hypothetical protein